MILSGMGVTVTNHFNEVNAFTEKEVSAAASCDSRVARLLWRDDHLKRKRIADHREIGFQASGIADSSFGIVDETDQGAAINAAGIVSGIHLGLLGQFFRCDTGLGFFYHNDDTVFV